MERCSPGTSVGFQRPTRHYIPVDRTLHHHRCENLKSYNMKYISSNGHCPIYIGINSNYDTNSDPLNPQYNFRTPSILWRTCSHKHCYKLLQQNVYTYLFLCQRLNTATSSPADDEHHYVIPQKLLDSILNKLPVFMRQWEKQKAALYPVQVPPP
jgi:hypothetical protein